METTSIFLSCWLVENRTGLGFIELRGGDGVVPPFEKGLEDNGGGPVGPCGSGIARGTSLSFHNFLIHYCDKKLDASNKHNFIFTISVHRTQLFSKHSKSEVRCEPSDL